jgi:hypothetical protein
MTNFRRVAALANEIANKQDQLKQMTTDWQGDDPCAAAMSDPSDQYVLGTEIEGLIKDLETELLS